MLPLEAWLADRKNAIHVSTTISTGRAVGIVTATGMYTELGKIANDIAQAETPKTPLEHNQNLLVNSLASSIGCCNLIISIELILTTLEENWGSSNSILGCNFNIRCYSSRGLPIILVTTLAIGMRNMARHTAIIRRMSC